MIELLKDYLLKKDDGAIEGFIKTLKALRGHFINVDLATIITIYDSSSPYKSLLKLADIYNLSSCIYSDITVADLKTGKNISILKIDTKDSHHFVVCMSFKEGIGFKIYDPLNGSYNATEYGLNCMWKDKTAIVFIGN